MAYLIYIFNTMAGSTGDSWRLSTTWFLDPAATYFKLIYASNNLRSLKNPMICTIHRCSARNPVKGTGTVVSTSSRSWTLGWRQSTEAGTRNFVSISASSGQDGHSYVCSYSDPYRICSHLIFCFLLFMDCVHTKRFWIATILNQGSSTVGLGALIFIGAIHRITITMCHTADLIGIRVDAVP